MCGGRPYKKWNSGSKRWDYLDLSEDFVDSVGEHNELQYTQKPKEPEHVAPEPTAAAGHASTTTGAPPKAEHNDPTPGPQLNPPSKKPRTAAGCIVCSRLGQTGAVEAPLQHLHERWREAAEGHQALGRGHDDREEVARCVDGTRHEDQQQG